MLNALNNHGLCFVLASAISGAMNEISDAFEPEDLQRDRKAPLRRCIVSRQSYEKSELIRFSISPEGILVPDIAEKLPGRGFWTRCSKAVLADAITRKAFEKMSKKKVSVPEQLPDQTEHLLREAALQSLSLAKKAGQVLSGFEKVAEALKSGQVVALLHAQDASPDIVKKLAISEELRFCSFHADALSARLGAEHAVHVALLRGAAGEGALKKMRRLTRFLENDAL